MTTIRAVARGCGHYLPARVVENDEFSKTLDTSDEWIRTRTGIERRHFAAEGELTSDLAIAAARAIDIPVTGIDLMVKSPRQPEYIFVEANERPGLANHEPQPTAERFVDLLFPLSIPEAARAARRRIPR